MQDAINDYIADKINVEIAITDIASGEYGDKANLALSNNEVNLSGQQAGTVLLQQIICMLRMQYMTLPIW